MAQTLGQAYKGYGAARRDALEGQRRFETINKGLEAGAELSFAASSQLEAAEKTSQEFKTAEKMLGDDVQQIDLETGEAWKERSILGRGDSVSYLNPFEWGGERGLRVGETLYSEADVSGISKDKDFYNIKAGDEKGLATYRENLQSVYGTDAKDTDWWKKEQAGIKSAQEDKDIAAYKEKQMESDKKRLEGIRVIGESQAGIKLESLHQEANKYSTGSKYHPQSGAGEIGETKIEEGFVPQRELARISKAEANWQRYKQDLISQAGADAEAKVRTDRQTWRESTPEWKQEQLRIKMANIQKSRGRVKQDVFTESEEAGIKTAAETRMAPLRGLQSQLKERDYKYMPGKDLEGDAIWSELMDQISKF